MRQYKSAYLMARLPIAMSMFGHGLTRLPRLDSFSLGMTQEFSRTWLPSNMVQAFGFVLPFMELLTGICLILGIFTRQALVVGVLLMVILIFGSSLIDEWQNVAIQMFYGIYFAALLVLVEHNGYSLDARRIKA